MGMFNNRCFASNSLNYLYFSKKYRTYDTFTLAIGLVILAFWKSVCRFLPDLASICNLSRKTPHLALSHYYQTKR